MKVLELSRDQKIELKQRMLESVLGCRPSWYDLADADNVVGDEQMVAEYGGTSFCNEDFFCSCN